jgi:hypothetical protein
MPWLSDLQRGQLGALQVDPQGEEVFWDGEGPHIYVGLSVGQHLN